MIQGPKGSVFNQATQFYYKSGFYSATANDTTGFITFSPATEIRVFERCNDSAKVMLQYQLRNSTLNKNSAWALFDSSNVAAGLVASMDTVMAEKT